jgi:hypothetical protein
MEITVPAGRLVEFCRKARDMPLFTGLEVERENNTLVVSVPGEGDIRFPLDRDVIVINETFFKSDYPDAIYYLLEGLASVFNGHYVVDYINEKGEKNRLGIIDGLYTSCGDRCLAKSVVFPHV